MDRLIAFALHLSKTKIQPFLFYSCSVSNLSVIFATGNTTKFVERTVWYIQCVIHFTYQYVSKRLNNIASVTASKFPYNWNWCNTWITIQTEKSPVEWQLKLFFVNKPKDLNFNSFINFYFFWKFSPDIMFTVYFFFFKNFLCSIDMMISFFRWWSMFISSISWLVEITWLIMTYERCKKYGVAQRVWHFVILIWEVCAAHIICAKPESRTIVRILFEPELVTFCSNNTRFLLCPSELWPSETISVLTCFPILWIVSASSKIIITP